MAAAVELHPRALGDVEGAVGELAGGGDVDFNPIGTAWAVQGEWGELKRAFEPLTSSHSHINDQEAANEDDNIHQTLPIPQMPR